MPIDPTSKAAAVGSSVQNVALQTGAGNLPRKVLIIGTYDPAKTTITDEVPVQIFSSEDAGDKYGFGSMIHRLAVQAFIGGQGVPVYVQPQSEAGGAVAASGEIDWAGTAGVVAGTLYLYIAGIYVPVAIITGMTLEEVSDAVVAAVNAKKELPVMAAKTAVTFETTFTAKSKGPWGNDISIDLNLGLNQSTPTGIVAAITPMAAGATNPDISTALDGLGIGDDANEDYFTDVVHGYGLDTTVLDAISAYVGSGDTLTGLYAKTVARPFRALTGDVATGTAGLAALQVIADARKTDRANGVIAVPGSQSHPSEIAAQAIGHMARINQNRVAEHYVDTLLVGVWPGDKGSDRWTSDYDNRDIAVKGGISPTKVKSGSVYLQNVVTFYRPDSVPVDSNGYREMVNISKIQNMMHSQRSVFESEKWRGVFIVADVTNVTSTNDRTKARDIDSVKDEMVSLYQNTWASKGWIADADYSIEALKESGSVTVRTGGDGFNITSKVVLSGIGNIIDAKIEFDTSFAVLS